MGAFSAWIVIFLLFFFFFRLFFCAGTGFAADCASDRETGCAIAGDVDFGVGGVGGF